MKSYRLSFKSIFFIFFLFISIYVNAQSIIYVKADASGSNNGTSWTNAYTDLQSALSLATASDTIWVAAGTYKPTTGTDRYSTFQLVSQVPLIGGFYGNETHLSERDYINNRTILSGDIGTVGDSTDNVYHVVYAGDSTFIDGLIIEGGYADYEAGGITYGGGLVCDNASAGVSVKNCVFQNNYAYLSGGAISISSNNSASNSFYIQNCIFQNNKAYKGYEGMGGAINIALANLKVVNSVFKGNEAFYGSAFYNSTEYNSASKSANFINCTFYESHNEITKSEIHDKYQPSHFTNCIFKTNHSIFFNEDGSFKAEVNYSCLYSDALDPTTYTGTGNIIADPLFISDSTLQLQSNSPCIDVAKGDSVVSPDYYGSTTFDNPNIANTGIGTPDYADMGAFEFYTDKLIGEYVVGSTGLFHTFTEAVDSMISGGIGGAVTFNVQSGTYTEQVTIPEITGASAINTITFQAASGDSTDVTLQYAATDENLNYTLKLVGADYFVFKNITFESKGALYARIVEFDYQNSSHHNTFSNNRFKGVHNQSELVFTSASADSSSVFTNNLFELGKVGIQMKGYGIIDSINIENNKFLNQTDTAILVEYYNYTQIKSNVIHSDNHITGVLLHDNRENITLEQNKIYLPNGGYGIHLDGCRLATDTSNIFNNHIYINTNEADKGIYIQHYFLSKIKIYHNTIHIKGNNTLSVCYDMYYGGESYYYNLYNNNFANKAQGMAMGTNRCGGDFNNFYSNGAKLSSYQETLEDWQDAYNHDYNSVSVDPYFEPDSSYHILNPVLNNAATPLLEITEDIDGEPRDATNPDIGADEFTPSPVPLNGTYTIAGTLPDYETINDAVKDLTINGVDGAVIFNIATDTLIEQISIPEISGASASNTITFQSATGDSTDVLIHFTPVNTTHKYTIRLDGVDYLRFKNVSILSDEEWGWPVELKNEATHNIFEGNKIFMTTQATSNEDYALVYSEVGSSDSSNVFNGNYFENGSNGIYLDNCASGIKIKNNVFSNISRYGIYLKNIINPEITGNYIDASSTGIYLLTISSTNTEKGLIANNIILALDNYGIYLGSSNDLSIVYNTVKVDAGNNSFKASGNNLDIINNIFVINQGSYAAEISDTTDCNIDYNLYYNSDVSHAEMYYSTGHTTDLEQYGFDLNSRKKEPEFLSDTNLHTKDPWLNNWGTPISEVTTDIDGDLRDTENPDVGADEFNGIMPFEGEYTIGVTGDFKTFTEALDTITPVGISGSVTFKVQSGTYNEQIVIGAIPEVNDSTTITFTSVSGDSTDVILQFDATASENYTIKMDSCSFITFQNITIKALNADYSNVIDFTGGATDNTFSNNVLEGNGITYAVIHSDGKENDNNQIINNLIKDGNVGVQMYGESVSVRETGTNIIGNVFENQHTTAIALKWNSSTTITKNHITHPEVVAGQWTGIYLTECSSGLIANNLIAFNTESMSAGIVLSGTTGQKIYNNSINIFGSHNDSRAFNQQNGGSGNYVYNNIFSNKSGGLVVYTTDINSFTSDNNNYYSSGDRFIYYGASDTEFYWISDLETWQSDYSKDPNSFSVDPQFVSETNLLPGNIVLDGSGTPLTEVTEDLNGIPRDPVNPDIGAYEFDGCTVSGTFTIGATGANYSTFKEAIESLQTCWVDGPIVFNVQSGTYNEQLVIPEIPRLSVTNTVTFQSDTGDSTDVILTWASTSADTNYTVKLDGADFIRFKNMTIQATGSDYAKIIELNNGASNNQFHNNRFIGVNTTDPSNPDGALVFSPNGSAYDTNTVFKENLFLSGSHGIYLNAHYSNYENNNQIVGNRFENQISYAMYLYYQDSALISENEILNASSDKKYYGIYFAGKNSLINKNRININADYSANTGLYVDADAKSIISNNFIHVKRGTGMQLFNGKVFYNSVNISGDDIYGSTVVITNQSGNACDFKNNIVQNSAGGKAINCGSTALANLISDYNNLYSNGEYLARTDNDIIDLAEWTATTSLDAHSISVNPRFESDSNLYTHNPIINNAGTPLLEVTDDIDGNIRDAVTPDIGASEFSQAEYLLDEDTIHACADDTVTLNAGNGYDTYSWSNGENTQVTKIDTAGIGLNSIKLISTVSVNGQEYKDSVWLSFHKPDALVSDVDTCSNSTVELIASGGVSYDWYGYSSNHTSSQSVYIYDEAQDYIVTVYDAYGCTDKDTATVTPYSKPWQPYIYENNDSLYCDNNDGTNYEWYLNSTIMQNTTQIIDPPESGDYQVIVYNHVCPSDISDIYTYNNPTGIGDFEGNMEMTLYPNPVKGLLYINFEKSFNDLRIDIISSDAKQVLTKLLKNVNEGDMKELDLEEIPPGLYFIRFSNNNISRTARILVQ